MKIWFADTSALIKRYIREPGSDWLRGELIRREIWWPAFVGFVMAPD